METPQYEYLGDVPADQIVVKVSSKIQPGKLCVVTKDAQKYFVTPGARPAAKKEAAPPPDDGGKGKPKE